MKTRETMATGEATSQSKALNIANVRTNDRPSRINGQVRAQTRNNKSSKTSPSSNNNSSSSAKKIVQKNGGNPNPRLYDNNETMRSTIPLLFTNDNHRSKATAAGTSTSNKKEKRTVKIHIVNGIGHRNTTLT